MKTIKTMYEINRYCSTITAIKVVAETKDFVTVKRISWNGQTIDRHFIKAPNFYDTFDDAKAALIAMANRELACCESNLSKARDVLNKCNALQPPAQKGDE